MIRAIRKALLKEELKLTKLNLCFNLITTCVITAVCIKSNSILTLGSTEFSGLFTYAVLRNIDLDKNGFIEKSLERR